ncbi:hypothetical protein RB595_003424 [Gaeumannomyces hyphopodioides]
MATETPALPPTKQSAPLGAVAFTVALSTAALVLRIAARWCGRTRLCIDDYLAIGLFLSIAATGVGVCFMIGSGLGRHAWTLTKEELRLYLRAYYVTTVFYYLGLFTAKMTFLFQYQKLPASAWSQDRWFLVTTGVIGITSFAEFVINLFACVPLEGFWNPAVDARCIPEQPYRYVFVGVDAIGALFILLLPALFMHTISVDRPGAVVIAIVYALGLFVVILQFVRIRYVDLGVNFTWVNADRAALMMAELSVALLCSCALLLHPLAERLIPRWFCTLEFDRWDAGNNAGIGYSYGSGPTGDAMRTPESPVFDRRILGFHASQQQRQQQPSVSPPGYDHTPALYPRSSSGFSPFLTDKSTIRSVDSGPKILMQKMLNHTPRNYNNPPLHRPPVDLARAPRQRQPRPVDDSGDASDDIMGLQSARRGLRHTSFGARGTASEGNLRTFFAAAPTNSEDERQDRASAGGQPQSFPAPPPRFAQPEPVRPSGVVVRPPPWMISRRWNSQPSARESPGPPIRSSSLGRRIGNDVDRGVSVPSGWDGGSIRLQWQQSHEQQQGQLLSRQDFQPPRPASAEPVSKLRRSATYHASSCLGRQLPPPRVHITHGCGYCTGESRPPGC